MFFAANQKLAKWIPYFLVLYIASASLLFLGKTTICTTASARLQNENHAVPERTAFMSQSKLLQTNLQTAQNSSH